MRLGEGGQGAVGGALLGALLGGPFGAVWGAQLGGALGSAKAKERANEARLERLGLSRDLREKAAACAADLAEAEEGRQLARTALESAQRVERNLAESASESYAAAQAALSQGDEAAAREHLLKRYETNTRLSAARISSLEAAERVATMESAVQSLSEQAMQMEQLLRRAVASKSATLASQDLEDPLLRKFRELEGL